MQEELENKTVTLIVNGSKFSARTLAKACSAFLRHTKNKIQKHQSKNVQPKGKQSVKKLIGQNQGVKVIDLSDDESVRDFDRVARKYGVDYAIKKTVDENGKSRYMLFFKGRDEDAIIQAFQEYTQKVTGIKKDERPSIHKLLEQIKAILPGQGKNREKNKEIVR